MNDNTSSSSSVPASVYVMPYRPSHLAFVHAAPHAAASHSPLRLLVSHSPIETPGRVSRYSAHDRAHAAAQSATHSASQSAGTLSSKPTMSAGVVATGRWLTWTSIPTPGSATGDEN